jgi:hypothetical protein
MAEDNPQPQKTADPPQAPPQQPTGQQNKTLQGQSSGQRRNDRHDRSRYHGGRRDHHRRDTQQPVRPKVLEKPVEAPGKDQENEDDEETEQDRSSSQGRHHHHRGGRQPKRIIEEWANDPYCE